MSTTERERLNEAQRVLRQGGALPREAYERAEKSLGDLLTGNPDNREARLLRGILLGKLERLSEGEAVLEALLKESPRDPVVLNDLGVLWLQGGKLQDALGAFLDAIELDPTRAEFQYNLGEAHKRLGKLNAASMAYGRAAELDPDFGSAYNNLGVALFKLGKPEKALFFFSRILERDPAHVKAQKNREAVRQAQDEGRAELPLEEDTDPFFVFFDEAGAAPEAPEPPAAAEAPETAGAKGPGSDRTSVLELLRFLRLLSGELPPKAQELYRNSDARLTMEFIIGALEGHIGLFREIHPAEPVSTAPVPAPADTLDYIRKLAVALAEGDLPGVLNRKVEELISELQRDRG
ncbi:MAG: tetratricopeptide repeat protein [Spirochaetaceae bacterium]|jgi:tetratricopeptide (TPR) repeat protein|nr:tetratricopeptide repeat protein [Spirochaetaceae bacterium]